MTRKPLDEQPLTFAQERLLSHLRMHGPLSRAELAAILGGGWHSTVNALVRRDLARWMRTGELGFVR